MYGREVDAAAMQRCYSSLLRVAVSRRSIETTYFVLERSRKSIEESAKKLADSQRLVRNPFSRGWDRTTPQHDEC